MDERYGRPGRHSDKGASSSLLCIYLWPVQRWNYVCRTTPGISQYLKKLEHKVKECFIPAIIDRAFGCQEIYRKIFALPIKEGGLGIVNLSLISDLEYEYSCKATMELTEAIFQQAPSYIEDHDKLVKVKDEISSARKDFFKGKRSEILLELDQNQKIMALGQLVTRQSNFEKKSKEKCENKAVKGNCKRKSDAKKFQSQGKILGSTKHAVNLALALSIVILSKSLLPLPQASL